MSSPNGPLIVPIRLYAAEIEIVRQLEKKLGLKLPQLVRFGIHRLAEREGKAGGQNN